MRVAVPTGAIPFTLLPLALLVSPPLGAWEGDAPPDTTPHAFSARATEEHPDSHALHAPNEFMLFVGDTRKAGANAFTIGIDYFRSVGANWGAGIFLDHAREEFEREYIAGAGVFLAPISRLPGLHLFAGGGWERLDEDHAHGGHGPGGAPAWTTENLLLGRVGGSFAIHLGRDARWVLAPQIFYDVVEGPDRDAVVFGLGIGRLF